MHIRQIIEEVCENAGSAEAKLSLAIDMLEVMGRKFDHSNPEHVEIFESARERCAVFAKEALAHAKRTNHLLFANEDGSRDEAQKEKRGRR
jgi:hypothetical protein